MPDASGDAPGGDPSAPDAPLTRREAQARRDPDPEPALSTGGDDPAIALPGSLARRTGAAGATAAADVR